MIHHPSPPTPQPLINIVLLKKCRKKTRKKKNDNVISYVLYTSFARFSQVKIPKLRYLSSVNRVLHRTVLVSCGKRVLNNFIISRDFIIECYHCVRTIQCGYNIIKYISSIILCLVLWWFMFFFLFTFTSPLNVLWLLSTTSGTHWYMTFALFYIVAHINVLSS